MEEEEKGVEDGTLHAWRNYAHECTTPAPRQGTKHRGKLVAGETNCQRKVRKRNKHTHPSDFVPAGLTLSPHMRNCGGEVRCR